MALFSNPFKRQSRTQGRFSKTKSECIENVNFNPQTGTLQVTFHNPQIGKWEYYNVPVYEAAGLISASSRGAYFNQFIRDRYEYSHVE